MKASDRRDAQAIAGQLEQGTATRRDVVALLIYIREHIPNDMVKDIAHCVAHDDRDRGLAYNYIETFIAHFIEIAERGGMLEVGMLFPLNQVAGELVDNLRRLGITIDDKEIDSHLTELEQVLSEVLDGISIKVRNPRVAKCGFGKLHTNQGDNMGFTVHFVGLTPGVLTIPPNVGMAFPVFR